AEVQERRRSQQRSRPLFDRAALVGAGPVGKRSGAVGERSQNEEQQHRAFASSMGRSWSTPKSETSRGTNSEPLQRASRSARAIAHGVPSASMAPTICPQDPPSSMTGDPSGPTGLAMKPGLTV